jgi:4-amino-4-deoxy-L-arabinose transferase-like glycosyltransferase
MKWWDHRKLLFLIYLGAALYLVPMFPHGGSANEMTRWATAVSLYEKHSFEISWTQELIGPNVDTAKIGDRLYSNKAPGPALLAVPIYALTRIFIGPPDASNIRISWYVMRLALSTLPLLLLAIWLSRREVDPLALATLLFATPLFIYSVLFFSHTLVAVLVYAVFRLLYDDRAFAPKYFVLAGLLAGLAVISEFPAVFAVVPFAVGLLFQDPVSRWKRLACFVLGGLPFLVVLLAYNHALFGSAFSTSYAHESSAEWAEVASHGVFGINWPTPANAFLLLLSPSRGLFFFAPILLLSVYGFFRAQEWKSLRGKIKFSTIMVSVVLLCGHGAAHGGWAAGPRYLVFIIPLLLDSDLIGNTRTVNDLWRGLLFVVSLLFCAIPTFTFPFAPPEFRFPHQDFWLRFLADEKWFTPNFVNLLGWNGISSLLPYLACLGVLLLLVTRTREAPRKFAFGLLLGLVLVGAYLFIPLPDHSDPEAAFRRATIAERFFKPANRVERIRQQAESSGDWATVQRANEFAWSIADARSFAPNDFPYLETRDLSPSPVAVSRSVVELQAQGKTAEAAAVLRAAVIELPFAKCDFTADLAVISYASGRKDEALRELESVQSAVNPGSRAGCLRSQYLLGSLYAEAGRAQDANQAFNRFLTNSAYSSDPEIREFRNAIQREKR